MAHSSTLPSARALGSAVHAGVVGMRGADHANGATITGRANPHHFGAFVTGNGRSTRSPEVMNESVITRAIVALQSAYQGEGAAQVAAVVASFKRAQALNKGQNASLFEGFLTLAGEGAEPDAVRKVGANIRVAVTAAMREAAHLPAKRTKDEKGAPDFSTASVYAGIVADALEAHAKDADEWRAAQDFIISQAGDAGLPVHDESGLIATKGGLQRAVKRFATQRADRMEATYPALKQVLGDAEARTLEQLEQDNAAMRARIADLLRAGTPGQSVEVARRERDAARDEVQSLTAALASARAEAQAARDEASALRASYAEASSATAQ
jgi:hypothetical protein